MAKTAFATNNALTKKAWEEQLFRDTKKESYFAKFMGSGSDALCQEKSHFTKDKGDAMTFGIRMRLAGAGVTSGQALEGNEEALTTYDYSVSLEEYAHAVRDRGPLDRQRAMFSIDEESQSALKDWGAEKIDDLAFKALIGTAAASYSTRVFYATAAGLTSNATAATASAALTAADSKLSPALIEYTRTWCLTGGNRGQTPLRPVRVDGKKYFVLLVHPDALFDLRMDPMWLQANREAQERGSGNPIFSGADSVWNGVIVHSHENVPIALTGGAGSNVPFARCALIGAQSLVWAWGKRPSVVAKTFDYDREHGYAWSMIAGTGKPRFNSRDYGSVGVYVSRTRISDAA
jgi:N4-gp56 family major capsid protein